MTLQPQTITWWTILVAILGSGVISAFIGAYFTARRAKYEAMRQAAYAAVRACLELELFSRECAEGLSDLEDYLTGNDIDLPHLPQAPNFSDDIDWRQMKSAFISDVLVFPSEINGSKRRLAYSLDFDKRHYAGEYEKEVRRLGLRAWSIAKSLRHHYKIPQLTNAQLSWPYPGYLERPIKHR